MTSGAFLNLRMQCLLVACGRASVGSFGLSIKQRGLEKMLNADWLLSSLFLLNFIVKYSSKISSSELHSCEIRSLESYAKSFLFFSSDRSCYVVVLA